jgi:RHS repeat-associated protein
MMDALVIHFGMVNLWTKIFTVEPGTEITYLPALRNANKRLFLYQSMLLLNSNSNMRYYIENHTEPNSTVAEWKAAVKKSFGLNYYNDMTLEILEQYATFYWVYELQEQYMYGSSRLGSVQRNLPLVQQVLNSDSLLYYSYANDSIRYMERGQKRYELSNHTSTKLSTGLGNVLAVVSDRKLVHCSNDELMWFEAQVVSVTVPIMSGYPFGMEIKERSWSVSAYRYGFNGMERDDELKGSGNSYDFGARIYDSRLGRWLSVDIIDNASIGGYTFASNSPITFIDPDGNDEFIFHKDGSTSYVKKSFWYNLFHKHVVKVEQPNGSFITATMQDQKNDPIRYQGKLVENPKKSANGGEALKPPTKAVMTNENDICDAISGKTNDKLNIIKPHTDVYSYDETTDGNLINWMETAELDWGFYSYENEAVYIIQDESGEYMAYNPQNFGNFTYGAFAQQLGLSERNIKTLGHLYNIKKHKSLDSKDDQDAIERGYKYSKGKNGEVKKVNLGLRDRVKQGIFKGSNDALKNEGQKREEG